MTKPFVCIVATTVDLLQKNFKSYLLFQDLSHETELMGIYLFHKYVYQILCEAQQR